MQFGPWVYISECNIDIGVHAFLLRSCMQNGLASTFLLSGDHLHRTRQVGGVCRLSAAAFASKRTHRQRTRVGRGESERCAIRDGLRFCHLSTFPATSERKEGSRREKRPASWWDGRPGTVSECKEIVHPKSSVG